MSKSIDVRPGGRRKVLAGDSRVQEIDHAWMSRLGRLPGMVDVVQHVLEQALAHWFSLNELLPADPA